MNAVEFAIFLSRKKAVNDLIIAKLRDHVSRYPIGIAMMERGLTISYRISEPFTLTFDVWDEEEALIDTLEIDLRDRNSSIIIDLQLLAAYPADRRSTISTKS